MQLPTVNAIDFEDANDFIVPSAHKLHPSRRVVNIHYFRIYHNAIIQIYKLLYFKPQSKDFSVEHVFIRSEIKIS